MMELKLNKFSKRIVEKLIIPPKTGIYEDFPEDLEPELQKFLTSMNIEKLYGHQVEMFNRSQKGENIIITTATASGKTLSFLLPVINKILKNPSTRALFIYPTKALTSDQFRNIVPVLEYFGDDRINAGIYDGDTPTNERSRIRKEANIILTNPEMLNAAFLPNHNKYGFNYIFQNLKYVVIDELHYYRGAFGSHIANIIRRVKRICKFYSSNPQFFCSTATIANPIELAENIFNSKFSLTDEDCSPKSEKEVFFWVPPFIKEEEYRRIPKEMEASNLIREIIPQGHKFIAFSQSRRELEVILKEVRQKFSSDGDSNARNADFGDLISGYRGGYKVNERKEIEKQMINGKIRGVIATNALELGIDIGDLDLVISIGFPKTKASFLQQIGRAGRKGKKSYAIVILEMNRAYDQYISLSPEWVFNSNVENAVIDKDNLFIQIAHTRAAAAELPLSLDDIRFFPDLGEILPVLLNNKELIKNNGKFSWNGNEFPAGDYSLRTVSENRYKIINKENSETLSEMEEMTVYKEAHPNAIYIHDGEMYLVEKLDVVNRIAEVIPVDYDYYTQPCTDKNLRVINVLAENKSKNIESYFGDVRVSIAINEFKKIQFHNHYNLGNEKIDMVLEKTIETEGIWIKIPNYIRDFIDTKLSFEYYVALATVIINAFMISTMTSDNDVGSVNFHADDDEDQPTVNIAIYDNYIGGLGFAEKGYELIEEIVFEAFKIVENCKCKNGCPACVGSYKIDKKVILWALKYFFEEEKDPENVEIIEIENVKYVEEKLFKIEEIETKWNDFRKLLKENYDGAYLSSFVQSVETVKYSNDTLTLEIEKYFDEDLIGTPKNIDSIRWFINNYFDSKNVIAVKFSNISENKKKDKIERRYFDLMK